MDIGLLSDKNLWDACERRVLELLSLSQNLSMGLVVKSFVVVRWNRGIKKLRHSCTLWLGILFNMAIYMQVYGLVFYVFFLIF